MHPTARICILITRERWNDNDDLNNRVNNSASAVFSKGSRLLPELDSTPSRVILSSSSSTQLFNYSINHKKKYLIIKSYKYLAMASMVGMPWFLITDPSGLARLCGIAGESSAEWAAAGCGSCMNCMCPKCGGWLYPLAKRGDFSILDISATKRMRFKMRLLLRSPRPRRYLCLSVRADLGHSGAARPPGGQLVTSVPTPPSLTKIITAALIIVLYCLFITSLPFVDMFKFLLEKSNRVYWRSKLIYRLDIFI